MLFFDIPIFRGEPRVEESNLKGDIMELLPKLHEYCSYGVKGALYDSDYGVSLGRLGMSSLQQADCFSRLSVFTVCSICGKDIAEEDAINADQAHNFCFQGGRYVVNRNCSYLTGKATS